MSVNNKPTVLVTGGAGYIGSHTCKMLSQRGFNPVVLDSMVYGHDWAVKWGPLIKGDILDSACLDHVFSQYKPCAVIHFAAFAYVGESVTNPGKYYTNNVTGTISLLEAMRCNNCDKIVFSSTCATYGVPKIVPIPEDHPQSPINPYGWSKWMIEQAFRDYSHAYGLKFASLRYFNAAGADPDGEVGEDHDPETHLIPLVIAAALGQRANVKIFGTDYPTPDGSCIRDYIHVTDLADAHLRALNYLEDKQESLFVNLGTGLGNSVREIIEAVRRVSGRDVPFVEAERREGDPPMLVAAPGRAGELLGWKPSRTDIDEIVGTAWRWHASRV